ncbi:MAG TPA: FHA domain-containing protein, partial [Bryobacteraceae bacterium]|nr:FHA domain-containing protein [Bryobacteraceae bacterium]
VFEAPFSGDPRTGTLELAEIRLALLDEIKAKSRRISGRHVFPFNRVTVLIRGVRDSEVEAFTSPFVSEMLESEVKSGLVRARCRFPDDLRLKLETTPDLPVEQEKWLAIQAELEATEPTPKVHPAGRLVVVRGTANKTQLPIVKGRTNIGRTVDVQRSDGPSRRNDLAFSEDSEINRTVSREHAHVRFSRKTGEYRIFNDRAYRLGNGAASDSNCGLWIIRDGLSYPVHRDERGVRLRNGDEIQFGNAVVRFTQK